MEHPLTFSHFDCISGGATTQEIFGNAVLQIHKQECNSACSPANECPLDQNEEECPAIKDCNTCIENQIEKFSSCSWDCPANIGNAVLACAPSIVFPISWVGCMFGLVRSSCRPCMCSAMVSFGENYCNTIVDYCEAEGVGGDCENQVAEAAVQCLPTIEDPQGYAACVAEQVGVACKRCICVALCAISGSLCDALGTIVTFNCGAK